MKDNKDIELKVNKKVKESINSITHSEQFKDKLLDRLMLLAENQNELDQSNKNSSSFSLINTLFRYSPLLFATFVLVIAATLNFSTIERLFKPDQDGEVDIRTEVPIGERNFASVSSNVDSVSPFSIQVESKECLQKCTPEEVYRKSLELMRTTDSYKVEYSNEGNNSSVTGYINKPFAARYLFADQTEELRFVSSFQSAYRRFKEEDGEWGAIEYLEQSSFTDEEKEPYSFIYNFSLDQIISFTRVADDINNLTVLEIYGKNGEENVLLSIELLNSYYPRKAVKYKLDSSNNVVWKEEFIYSNFEMDFGVVIDKGADQTLFTSSPNDVYIGLLNRAENERGVIRRTTKVIEKSFDSSTEASNYGVYREYVDPFDINHKNLKIYSEKYSSQYGTSTDYIWGDRYYFAEDNDTLQFIDTLDNLPDITEETLNYHLPQTVIKRLIIQYENNGYTQVGINRIYGISDQIYQLELTFEKDPTLNVDNSPEERIEGETNSELELNSDLDSSNSAKLTININGYWWVTSIHSQMGSLEQSYTYSFARDVFENIIPLEDHLSTEVSYTEESFICDSYRRDVKDLYNLTLTYPTFMILTSAESVVSDCQIVIEYNGVSMTMFMGDESSFVERELGPDDVLFERDYNLTHPNAQLGDKLVRKSVKLPGDDGEDRYGYHYGTLISSNNKIYNRWYKLPFEGMFTLTIPGHYSESEREEIIKYFDEIALSVQSSVRE